MNKEQNKEQKEGLNKEQNKVQNTEQNEGLNKGQFMQDKDEYRYRPWLFFHMDLLDTGNLYFRR